MKDEKKSEEEMRYTLTVANDRNDSQKTAEPNVPQIDEKVFAIVEDDAVQSPPKEVEESKEEKIEVDPNAAFF